MCNSMATEMQSWDYSQLDHRGSSIPEMEVEANEFSHRPQMRGAAQHDC